MATCGNLDDGVLEVKAAPELKLLTLIKGNQSKLHDLLDYGT